MYCGDPLPAMYCGDPLPAMYCGDPLPAMYCGDPLQTSIYTNLLEDSPQELGHCWRGASQGGLQDKLMRETILLKPVQERLRDVLLLQIGLLHNHQALKVLVYATRLDVGPDCNVGVITRASVGVNSVEPPVEEVVETLVDGVCLTQDNSVTLSG